MSHGYATVNALAGITETSFTWSSAYTTGRARLNDGLVDEIASSAGSAQASGQTLIINLGSAKSLVGFAMLNHNLASGTCSVAIVGGTDSGVTAGLVSLFSSPASNTVLVPTTAPNHRDLIIQCAATASRQFWKITFTHTGTKIVTLGELMVLETSTTLSRATVYGAGETERYIQNRSEAKTGHARATFVGGPIRTKRLPFKDLVATTQRNELMAMWRATLGGVTDMLWIEQVKTSADTVDITAAEQECLFGKLQESLGWTQPDYALYDIDGLELIEQGREVGS